MKKGKKISSGKKKKLPEDTKPKKKSSVKISSVKKDKKKKTKKPKDFKKDFRIPWMEGFLFFLIFVSLGLIFVLGGSVFNSGSIDSQLTNHNPDSGPSKVSENLTEESQRLLEQEERIDFPTISTADWKTYSNSWYGFSLKYPPNWKPPVAANPILSTKNSSGNTAPDQWEKKYFFARPTDEPEDNLLGFDLFVYDLKKVSELRNTAQFPKVKESFSENPVSCNLNIGGHLIESTDFTAEEIHVPQKDKCLENTFFFTLVSERYIFNLIPKFKDNFSSEKDVRNEVITDLPDLFGAATSLNLIDIKRPIPKPKITAPMPAAYAMVGGRMVCNKKNDKPSRSDKTKHRHMDMECCLDPDEYPNPHCYYDSGKYGKYLK